MIIVQLYISEVEIFLSIQKALLYKVIICLCFPTHRVKKEEDINSYEVKIIFSYINVFHGNIERLQIVQ